MKKLLALILILAMVPLVAVAEHDYDGCWSLYIDGDTLGTEDWVYINMIINEDSTNCITFMAPGIDGEFMNQTWTFTYSSTDESIRLFLDDSSIIELPYKNGKLWVDMGGIYFGLERIEESDLYDISKEAP